jgi:hypothetical protein
LWALKHGAPAQLTTRSKAGIVVTEFGDGLPERGVWNAQRVGCCLIGHPVALLCLFADIDVVHWCPDYFVMADVSNVLFPSIHEKQYAL